MSICEKNTCEKCVWAEEEEEEEEWAHMKPLGVYFTCESCDYAHLKFLGLFCKGLHPAEWGEKQPYSTFLSVKYLFLQSMTVNHSFKYSRFFPSPEKQC